MPVQYVIHTGYRLVVTTGEGRVTFDEVRAHQDRLLNDPDFNPEFCQLMDGTSVADFALSANEIRRVVGRKLFSPMSRRALVVTNKFMYGMARMLSTYYEMSNVSSPMSIFHDRTSALKWLGIPEDSSLF